MRIAITGATGFIGSNCSKTLSRGGHEVIELVREREGRDAEELNEKTAHAEVRGYDPFDVDSTKAALEGAEAVVNLAGESLFGGYWRKAVKQGIRDSRVVTTRTLVDAMKKLEPRPRVLVSGSAVGYYGPRKAEDPCVENEFSASIFTPDDFLAKVCKEWEGAARRAETLGMRVVRLRVGMVLGDGGGLAQMETPFKLGLGGRIGSGKQVVSWIHNDDLGRLIRFCIENEEVSGPVNATAPNPVTNAEFTKALGRELGRPTLLPIPPIALKLKFGGASIVMTTGQRVLPNVALRHGFEFLLPTVDMALATTYLRKQKGHIGIAQPD